MMSALLIGIGIFLSAFAGTYILYPKFAPKKKELSEIFVMEDRESGKSHPFLVFLQRHKVYVLLLLVMLSMVLLRLYAFALLTAAAFLFLKKLREQQMKREIVRDLPAAVNIMKTAVKAGLPLQGAIKNVMDYSSSPKIREIFKRIYYMSSSMGKPLEKVIAEEAKNLNITEMIFLSSVIETHIAVGGNLVEMFDIIEANMRRFLTAKEKVASLLAESQLSAAILSIIPLGVVAFLLRINKPYMKFFLTPEGRVGLVLAVVFYLLGVILTFRMVKIKI